MFSLSEGGETSSFSLSEGGETSSFSLLLIQQEEGEGSSKL